MSEALPPPPPPECASASEPGVFRRLRQTPMRDLCRGRLSGRLDWRRTIAHAGLPEDARDRVFAVVKKTRLWRRERVDVAHELIAHFADGLEAQTPLEELLGSFGDVKRTAHLIRRAKKRQRHWLWKAKRACTWALGLLIVFYIGLGVYYSLGSPTVSVDYAARLNEKAAAVPDEDRAWPVYREALLELGPMHREIEDPMFDLAQGGWEELAADDPQWDALGIYMAHRREPVAQLRAAAAMPGLGYLPGPRYAPEDLPLLAPDIDPEAYAREATQPGDAYWLIHNHYFYLGALRRASRLLTGDAVLAARAGEADRCVADLTAALQTAEHCDELPALIQGLVRISIHALVYDTISRVVTEYPDLFSNEQLHALAHRIAATADHRIDLTGERMFFDDFLQHTFTDDGKGDGRLTLHGLRMMSDYTGDHWLILDDLYGESETNRWVYRGLRAGMSPALIAFAGSRREMHDFFHRLIDEMVAQQAIPIWEGNDNPVDERIIAIRNGPLVTQAKYAPAVAFMPALGAARRTSEKATARAEGVMLGLALELYRRAYGSYPDSLEALVPRYMPELPVDRITGGALGYRVGEDGPVVYSVGADRDDDGGFVPGKRNWDDEGEEIRVADPFAAASWLEEDAADGDWVIWPLHNPPVIPAP